MVDKKITVMSEDKNGRNQTFKVGNGYLNREQLSQSIKNGNHPNYHVRNINGLDTPVSNPDKFSGNNLG
ncbi:MAG: hypothetical protein ABS939_22645 [Psychrobacillus sp.]